MERRGRGSQRERIKGRVEGWRERETKGQMER